MKNINSVKTRIFIYNTLLVLVTLSLFFIVNLIFLKVYFHSIEQQLYLGHIQNLTNGQIEDLIENIFLENNHFYVYFFIDGLLCIFILIFISQLFTKKLTSHIMKPLDILYKATQRIKTNDLTVPIHYDGDIEFETICHTFNDMQSHLLQAQIKNEQYEKAKDKMIMGISHDLKTPLTVIKGSIKSILDQVVTTPQQQNRFLQIAYQRCEEMNGLLNHLLDLSLSNHSFHLNLKQIHIDSFLKNYVENKQTILLNEKLIFNSHYSKNLLIDSFQLERILDSLIDNSKKYAHCSPLIMTISTTQKQSFVDLCFQDNGQGVLDESLPHLFEEFYREDPSRHLPGHGLGLSIVKNIVEEMNGYVEAKNHHGLQIHLYFPIEGVENNEE